MACFIWYNIEKLVIIWKMELLGVECFCLPEWKLIIMTITLEIMSEFWSLNTVLIIAMIVCVWGQQFLLTKCFWGAMEPSRRSYWLLFHRSPFWRLWPAGSWGSWLTECSELEPTLYWPVSAEGFVDCSQWSDLLWEQKGLTFCFILTYPRLGVYFVFHHVSIGVCFVFRWFLGTGVRGLVTVPALQVRTVGPQSHTCCDVFLRPVKGERRVT